MKEEFLFLPGVEGAWLLCSIPTSLPPNFSSKLPTLLTPLYKGFWMYVYYQYIKTYIFVFWGGVTIYPYITFFSFFSYSTMTCRNPAISFSKVNITIPILQTKKRRLLSFKRLVQGPRTN